MGQASIGIGAVDPIEETGSAPACGSALDEAAQLRLRAEIIGRRSLPAAPEIVTKIVGLADANADVREMVTLLERDPALTGRVLRMANCAFFGQSRSVTTVSRALVVLGLPVVRSLALSMAVWDTMRGGAGRGDLERLWGHCVLVGVTARRLAKETRRWDQDEAFSAGLLHDTGRLLLGSRFEPSYWLAFRDAPADRPVEQIEREQFGIDHAVAAGWLFEAWNLPAAIVRTARLHHDPDPQPDVSGLIAVVSLLVRSDEGAATEPSPGAKAAFALAERLGIGRELWTSTLEAVQTDGSLDQMARL